MHLQKLTHSELFYYNFTADAKPKWTAIFCLYCTILFALIECCVTEEARFVLADTVSLNHLSVTALPSPPCYSVHLMSYHTEHCSDTWDVSIWSVSPSAPSPD